MSAKESKPSARDLEGFTEGLSLLLEAGLTASRALAVLSASAAREGQRALARRLSTRLGRGQGMAQALAAEGRVVPALYRDIVSTGEDASRLGPAFSRLSSWLCARRRFRDELASTLAYPSVVLAVLLGAALIARLSILPRMELFVSSLGPAAGEALRASLRRADAASSALALGAALLAALGTALALLRRGAPFAASLDRLAIHLPLVGSTVARRARDEFAFAMESLCAAGKPAGSALSLCAARAGNAALASDLRRAEAALRRGEGLEKACRPSAFFDAESLQWLSLADSGAKPLAAFQAMRASAEAALERSRHRAARLLDPALSIAMGALVASFVALFVLPLFEAMGSLFP